MGERKQGRWEDLEQNACLERLSYQPLLRLESESYKEFEAQHEEPLAFPTPNPVGDAVPEMSRRIRQPYDYNEKELEEVTHAGQIPLPLEMKCMPPSCNKGNGPRKAREAPIQKTAAN